MLRILLKHLLIGTICNSLIIVGAFSQTTAAENESVNGLQSVAGADAFKKASQEIDASVADELKKDANGNTKEGGIVDLIKKATDATLLGKANGDYAGAFNEQLQKDIVMLILAQVTSRLQACSKTEDMTMAIGAGNAFIVGEVAEYTQTESLKTKLETSIAEMKTESNQKQLEVFRSLKTEYQNVLKSSLTKQHIRDLSKNSFKTAAALAAAEAVEDETWATSCSNSNISMTTRGKNQSGDDILMYLAMAAAAYAVPFCGGCAAAAIYLSKKRDSDNDGQSCNAGFQRTSTLIADRKIACDMLGTEAMFTPASDPTITASAYIKNNCINSSKEVSVSAGSGCVGHSSSGAGPYTACDKAVESFDKNMSGCPVSILKAAKVSTLENSGITSEVGREFVRKASETISRVVDMRMASPRQRVIVWSVFAELAGDSVETNKLMINQIQTQLKIIQDIIDRLEAYAKGVQLNNGKLGGVSLKSQKVNIDELDMINLKSPTACMTGNDTAHCKSVGESLSENGGLDSISSDLKKSTLQMGSALNSLNFTKRVSSDDIATIRDSSKLQNSISAEFAKKTKQYNALQSFNKSKNNLNFKEESQSFANGLSKVTKNLLSNAGAKSNFKSDMAKKDVSPSANDNLGSDKNGLVPANLNPKFEAKSFENHPGLGTKVKGEAKTSPEGSTTSEASTATDASKSAEGRNEALLQELVDSRSKEKKSTYKSNENSTLFEKITNAYIRNYDKFLTKKKVNSTNEEKE